jgi:hypothetical protein
MNVIAIFIEWPPTKQKRDIGKYSSVNRTIQLWNQLPADALGTLSCKPIILGKGLGK